jgi:hypothetical protein
MKLELPVTGLNGDPDPVNFRYSNAAPHVKMIYFSIFFKFPSYLYKIKQIFLKF